MPMDAGVGLDGGLWPGLATTPAPASCGPACRLAVNAPINHPGYFSHAFATDFVADTDALRLLVAPATGGSATWVVDAVTDPFQGIVQLHVYAGYLSYLRVKDPFNRVEVVNLVTGARRVVFSYTHQDNQPDQVFATAVNAQYAFWLKDGTGLMSADLNSGAVRVLVGGNLSGDRMCATDTGLICSSLGGTVVAIDQQAGQLTALDRTHKLQLDGVCSPDRAQFVWVDYRDPLSVVSTLDYRLGGEIYAKDMVSGAVSVLTSDYLTRPIAKVTPAIDGDLALWHEQPASDQTSTPYSTYSLYNGASVLVKLDRTTGRRCRLDRPGFGPPSLHGHHMIAEWYDAVGYKTYLIDLDLDHPSLDWQCQ